ncbi:MAG: diaminopimelate decarboxylase, partial [Rickettsiales bacterium]|nr:diaminopimelate decarboxylase [Rickettsiales bacterium]
LMRPAIYDAYHDMITVRENKSEPSETDVVGPICETGDTFAKERRLPDMESGDLMAFRTAGAYGAVMANTYNTRLLVPEVLVKDDRFEVIRKRPDYDALIGLDTVPDWVA